MKRLFLAAFMVLSVAQLASAQTGVRIFGAQQFVLDDNTFANPKIYLSANNGSMGIDQGGFVTGTFPNASSMLTILAGTKTFGLKIDGGSTWGLDIVNTNNGIRSAGRNFFGDGAGIDDNVFNIGGGNLIINTLPAPALPGPLSNLMYVNGANQVQQTPGGVNIVTGSGTVNTVPLWTPNGFQLGNSILTQTANTGINVTPGVATTNNVLVVNGVADATIASVAGNNVWDSRINGDQLVTGIQKIGGSIWLDGTSATHQIVTDAPVNIGSKNGSTVSFVTNNTSRMSINAAGTIDIPTTIAGGAGMITQGGTRLIHSFGTNNFFAGAGAGNLTMTGISNTGVGFTALATNTSGNDNTATGVGALFTNTTGNRNTATGRGALQTNNGDNNTATGQNALSANTVGNDNTATGVGALFTNTTGNRNTAIGRGALQTSNGDNNTATGQNALSANTSGTDNTANGVGALFTNTGGSSNSATGRAALQNNTFGGNNTAVGFNAGLTNTIGNSNTFVGQGADATVNNLSNATAIGSGAVVSQSSSIVLGSGERVGIGVSNPGTLLSNWNGNNADQGGDGQTNGSFSWRYNAGGYAASVLNTNTVAVNPHGMIIKTTNTTASGRILVVNSGAGNGIDRFTVQGDGNVGIGVPNPARALHVKSAALTTVRIEGLPTFANDAAAGVGGLVTGDLYVSNVGGDLFLKVKF